MQTTARVFGSTRIVLPVAVCPLLDARVDGFAVSSVLCLLPSRASPRYMATLLWFGPDLIETATRRGQRG